jgi:hypothetical protein
MNLSSLMNFSSSMNLSLLMNFSLKLRKRLRHFYSSGYNAAMNHFSLPLSALLNLQVSRNHPNSAKTSFLSALSLFVGRLLNWCL